MTKLLRALLASSLVAGSSFVAPSAALATPADALVVAACAAQSYTAGQNRQIAQTTTGSLCTNASGSSGGGGGGGAGPSAFAQNGNLMTLSVTSSSARTILTGVGPVVLVRNTGTTDANVAFGDVTITASATNSAVVPAGATIAFLISTETYIAYITASGTTTLQATPGTTPETSTAAVATNYTQANGSTAPFNLGDATSNTPRVVQARPPITYSASLLVTSNAVTPLVVAATASDFYTITGPSSGVARIRRIQLSCTVATANGTFVVNIYKRSTANATGTSTTPALVAHDSANQGSALSVVRAYTANPGTLGTNVGGVRGVTFSGPTATTPTIPVTSYTWEFTDHGGQGLVLRSAAEVWALNANGSTSGATCTPDVELTETAD